MSASNETHGNYEQVSKVDGQRLHLVGHPFPLKCVPTLEAVEAVNYAKKHLLTPKRAWKRIKPYALPGTSLSPLARSIGKVARMAGADRYAKLAEHIFHYDLGYAYRLQDLFGSTTKESLLERPLKEILHLSRLHASRECRVGRNGERIFTRQLIWKFRVAALLLLIFIALKRKSFKRAIQAVDYSTLLMDEGDKYWVSKRTDYQFSTIDTTTHTA